MAEANFPWKIAWITGASGAICGEMARRLAAAGVTIAATARPGEKLDALAASSERIKAYPADVLKPDALKACVAKIESELGPIDLALLGAGMYVPFDIREYRPRRLPQHHGAQCRRRDQRGRRGAALDARAQIGPHRHHGLAVRLCRLAGATAATARARRR